MRCQSGVVVSQWISQAEPLRRSPLNQAKFGCCKHITEDELAARAVILGDAEDDVMSVVLRSLSWDFMKDAGIAFDRVIVVSELDSLTISVEPNVQTGRCCTPVFRMC
jgi:hypothetical protein